MHEREYDNGCPAIYVRLLDSQTVEAKKMAPSHCSDRLLSFEVINGPFKNVYRKIR